MPRNCLLALLAAFVLSLPAGAEEAKRLDDDKAREVAKLLLDATAKLSLPAKASPTDKGSLGLTGGKAVVFVMPDVKLTSPAIKKVDREVMPLAVLYTTDTVTLVSGEQPVAADQHRTAKITAKDKTVAVNVLTLAAARVADRLVLLVYAKDKKPAVVVELNESDDRSDVTIDLDARRVGKGRAALVVTFLGRYKAAIPLTEQAQE